MRILRLAALTVFAASAIYEVAPASGATIQPAVATFDGIGSDALATHRTPGFTFTVARNDAVVYAKGFGLANVARSVAVNPQTRFAVGSITKQFTAAAILLLAQRGKLGLDDPLSAYVPAFPNASSITLRMLLNQTSGAHNYPVPGEQPWPSSGPIALATLLPLLARNKPDFAPGARYEYSNTNYALLSAVVAKATGVDEATFLKRTIFAPLGMSGTTYGYRANEPSDATPYQGSGTFAEQVAVSLDLFAGAGALVSTAPDIAKWDIGLMHDAILSAASTQTMWAPGKVSDGGPTEYAMGFVPSSIGGHREVWHNGLAPGAGGYCFNAIFPSDKLAVVVLSNGYEFDGVPERMTARVLAAYDPNVAQAQPTASPSVQNAPPSLVPSATPPTPAPGEDPAVTARAKDWWNRLQSGTVDLTQVDAQFAQRLTPDFLTQVKQGMMNLGEPTDWIYMGSQSMPTATVYDYWVRVGGAPHVWSVGLTPDGKIAGSRLY